MNLPSDSPPAPPPTLPEVITDTPPVDREADFHRVFAWHGAEVKLTIAAELYYRELRAHGNAPALGDYVTQYDRDAEAPRLLYCAHLDAATIRKLRLLPPVQQLELLDVWTERNIPLHELRMAGHLADEMINAVHRARTQPAEGGEVDGVGNSPAHR